MGRRQAGQAAGRGRAGGAACAGGPVRWLLHLLPPPPPPLLLLLHRCRCRAPKLPFNVGVNSGLASPASRPHQTRLYPHFPTQARVFDLVYEDGRQTGKARAPAGPRPAPPRASPHAGGAAARLAGSSSACRLPASFLLTFPCSRCCPSNLGSIAGHQDCAHRPGPQNPQQPADLDRHGAVRRAALRLLSLLRRTAPAAPRRACCAAPWEPAAGRGWRRGENATQAALVGELAGA